MRCDAMRAEKVEKKKNPRDCDVTAGGVALAGTITTMKIDGIYYTLSQSIDIYVNEKSFLHNSPL